jgi:DNA-binding transcriptional ArsR family regulator
MISWEMDVERIRRAKQVDLDDRVSPVFAALADPTRRGLVARLAAGDADVGELAEPYDISIQAVSKHLKVLEGAGLVSKTNHGRRRTVHLEAEVFDLMTKWIERYRRRAEERYRWLDDQLDEMNDRTTPNRHTITSKEQTA